MNGKIENKESFVLPSILLILGLISAAESFYSQFGVGLLVSLTVSVLYGNFDIINIIGIIDALISFLGPVVIILSIILLKFGKSKLYRRLCYNAIIFGAIGTFFLILDLYAGLFVIPY